MKLSDNATAQAPENAKNYDRRDYKRSAAVIPLVKFEEKKLNKDDYETIELLTNPGDPNSLKRKLQVPYLCSGGPAEYIAFRKALETVINGQGLMSGPAKFRLLRSLIQDEAEAEVTTILAAEAITAETNPSFERVLAALAKHYFPRGAIAKQKRAMRRAWRKPVNWSERKYIAETRAIATDLKYYPNWSPEVGLSEDDLVDIIDYGNPIHWQQQMTLQGFDISEKSLSELSEFCERLELAEKLMQATHVNYVNPAQAEGRRRRLSRRERRGKSANNKRDRGKNVNLNYCPLHGPRTHPMQECEALKNQAKRMRQNWDAQADKKPNPYRNRAYVNLRGNTVDNGAAADGASRRSPSIANTAFLTEMRQTAAIAAAEAAKATMEAFMAEPAPTESDRKRKANGGPDDENLGMDHLSLDDDGDDTEMET